MTIILFRNGQPVGRATIPPPRSPGDEPPDVVTYAGKAYTWIRERLAGNEYEEASLVELQAGQVRFAPGRAGER